MTKIIFRKDKKTGEIIAFFKGINNFFISCYVFSGHLKDIGYKNIKVYIKGVLIS